MPAPPKPVGRLRRWGSFAPCRAGFSRRSDGADGLAVCRAAGAVPEKRADGKTVRPTCLSESNIPLANNTRITLIVGYDRTSPKAFEVGLPSKSSHCWRV